MKKKWNKVTAALLMLVMVVTTVLGAAPALSVKAEPVTMGHLKSGSGNANGHFGSATPEAFVLSEKADYTNQAYSLKLRINSDVDKTRLRIVTKYKDDNNWAFLMYDVGRSSTLTSAFAKRASKRLSTRGSTTCIPSS